MTAKRECASCEFFENSTSEAGLCRRLPPSLPLHPQDNQHPIMYVPIASWPFVKSTEWCGEWRRKL